MQLIALMKQNVLTVGYHMIIIQIMNIEQDNLVEKVKAVIINFQKD